MSQERLIEVYRAKNSLQAHLFQSALEEVGIKACIHGDASPEGLWNEAAMDWNAAPRIMVLEQDAEMARDLLLRLEAMERPDVSG
jgi:hypothetical protein